MQQRISIVIPCLNEVETIGTVIKKIVARAIPGLEIIVADNGSTDGTLDLLSSLPVVVVKVNHKGYGAALMGGIKAAQGKFIVMGDADDSYALEEYESFIEPLENGYDFVIGNRFIGKIEPGAMPLLHKYLGNPVLSFLGRKMFRLQIGDFHCGIRAFRKSSIQRLGLKTFGMEFATEMIAKAALFDMKIAEIPTTLRRDGRSRPPHLRTWRDGWRHLKFMLAYSPTWLLLYPGLSLILSGCALMTIDTFSEISIFGNPVGVMGLIASILSISVGLLLLVSASLFQVLIYRNLKSINLRTISQIHHILSLPITKYISLSAQIAVTVWFGNLIQSWINGELTTLGEIQRIKFGLLFLTVTSMNFLYFVYSFLVYFLDKELLHDQNTNE